MYEKAHSELKLSHLRDLVALIKSIKILSAIRHISQRISRTHPLLKQIKRQMSRNSVAVPLHLQRNLALHMMKFNLKKINSVYIRVMRIYTDFQPYSGSF